VKNSILALAFTACGTAPTTPTPPRDAAVVACTPPANSTALTYTQLFAQYLAPGTPGHCATSGCHADPGHNVWLCGTTAASCYPGMVQAGLVDPASPTASMIADPVHSPLAWVSASGNMPFDAPNPFPAGRDAVVAWVAACALDN
jgi:hypothetical protein